MGVLILIVLFLLFLFMGMPMGLILACTSFVYLILSDYNLLQMAQIMYSFLTQFVLLAVPLFIFAAQLMVETSMTDRILRFINSVLGFIKGGLSLVNIGSSMVFAGISGAAIADASSIGTIMWRSMVKQGYKSDYAAGLSAASAAVGPVIPPSIPMIVAGTMTGVSVGSLFIGGILPGIMMGVGMAIVALVLAFIKNHPSEAFKGFKEIGASLFSGFFDLMMPVVVIGSIIFGIATPTEASAMAVLYVLLIGIFRKELQFTAFKKVAVSTVATTAEVLFIASMAMILGWILTYEKVPHMIVEFVGNIGLNHFWLIFFMVIVLLLMGTFLSAMESLLIALPLFIPMAETLGMDLFHITLLVVLATNVGTISPPIGLTLYIMSTVSKESIWKISKAMLPFLLVNIIVVYIIAYFPQLTHFFVGLFN